MTPTNDLDPAVERILVFHPCSSATATERRLGAPEDSYANFCWLPLIGPTSWVLWIELSRRLTTADGTITAAASALTRDVGLSKPARLIHALERLQYFGLATSTGNGCWQIATTVPPVPERLLARLDDAGRYLHHTHTTAPQTATVESERSEQHHPDRDVRTPR